VLLRFLGGRGTMIDPNALARAFEATFGGGADLSRTGALSPDRQHTDYNDGS